MPKRTDITSILVIGSGPIVIGQAAEFDFSGSQACRSLREEGYTTVLVNSNPATIQTDLEMADIVYIEPLNVETIAEITSRLAVNRSAWKTRQREISGWIGRLREALDAVAA